MGFMEGFYLPLYLIKSIFLEIQPTVATMEMLRLLTGWTVLGDTTLHLGILQ